MFYPEPDQLDMKNEMTDVLPSEIASTSSVTCKCEDFSRPHIKSEDVAAGYYESDNGQFKTMQHAETDESKTDSSELERVVNETKDCKPFDWDIFQSLEAGLLCSEVENLLAQIMSFELEPFSSATDHLSEEMLGATFSEENLYTCSFCNFKSDQVIDFLKHSLASHAEKEPFKCDLCSYSTTDQRDLLNHNRVHAGKKPHRCNYSSCKRSDAKRHMANHAGKEPLKCDLCSYSTRTKRDLLKHKRTHIGKELHKCDLCDKSFTRRSSLNRHMGSHTGLKLSRRSKTGEKPLKCDLCSYTASKSCILFYHKLTHCKVKPFSCTFCDYKTIKPPLKVRHFVAG